ncbi:MAG: NAD(P)/FAD-dependent oxidoreductase [Candidatus Flexifilum sp.]
MVQDIEIVIVGAGLSGIMAARTLTEAGKKVVLLDKGRSPGGRMATRRLAGGRADHGAQFFTVRDARFQTLVEGWLAAGFVFEWSRGWSDGSLTSARDGHPRYAVRAGMNDLVQRLAAGLDVRTHVRVDKVRKMPGGWQIEDESGGIIRAEQVILTPPVPQSLELLRRSDVILPDAIAAELASIDYIRCIAVMLAVEGPVALPPPGAIQRPHAPITWIADNHAKGISESTIITMQASADYSAAMWDEPDEIIVRDFKIHLMPFISERTTITEAQVKRWRYSAPLKLYPERYVLVDLDGSILALAGDAFGAPRVEGAVLSGLAVGEALAQR